MSFGNISLLLKETKSIIRDNYGKDFNISLLELSILKNKIYIELNKKYENISFDIINEIFNRLFITQYHFNKKLSFEDGKNCFREFEDQYPDIDVPSNYKKLDKHFNKLKNLPQPAQRSKEWYDYRYNRITASDAAAAIDLNPYEPVESFILKKCDPNFPFRDNATVFHGKKYEPTATMIYEHIYNTRVFEFGALPSDKYSFLGASPDGICSKYTIDNNFSDRLGTMLEIKCPVTRDIHTNGKIAGDICPFYYYCQVQQQLACCELNVCDFWQCKISEYKNRNDYLKDNCKDCVNTIGNNSTKIDVDNRLKKGIILEFYPKNFIPEFEGDLAEWKSKYIIPKRLDMDESQYDMWVIQMMDQYKELFPDIHKDYYFYRIIYWKLEVSHNVSINRDDNFLASILPVLQETWDKIIYYRDNQDKLDELKDIVEKRKKYIKIDTTFEIHNEKLTKDKILFLDPNVDCSNILVKKKKTYNNYKKPSQFINNTKKSIVNNDHDSDACDFIDNNDCGFIDENNCDFIDDIKKPKTKKKMKK